MSTPDSGKTVAKTALAIAAALQHASPGDLAAMRRMRAGREAPLFWRLAARHREIDKRPEAWKAIARMLALVTPTGQPDQRPELHDQDRRLGMVLCDGGNRNWPSATSARPMLSEQRLARLLAARGKARREALERALRMLAKLRPPGPLVNVPDIAWAVLNPAADRIARDYYARLDQAAAKTEKDA